VAEESDWRIIRPYMIWQNPKKNLSLAGVPIEELQKLSLMKEHLVSIYYSTYDETKRGANSNFTRNV
jgi:hypothetical protein